MKKYLLGLLLLTGMISQAQLTIDTSKITKSDVIGFLSTYQVTQDPPSKPDEPASDFIRIGRGSGDLVISGKSGNYAIEPGGYNSITVENCKDIVVTGEGVKLTGNMKSLNISGTENATISGLSFSDNTFRAVVISGVNNNLTIQNLTLKNIGDAAIGWFDLKDQARTMKNICFKNITADNIGWSTIYLAGDLTEMGPMGLIDGLEVANIKVTNCKAPGSVVYIGIAENVNIYDNVIDNINASNNNHNGIYFIRGNGRFYNNTTTNYQGNVVRWWNCSIGTKKAVEIYNNICFNSRKYSAFEVAPQPYMYSLKGFLPTSLVKVYNNTVGRMNTDKDSYPGRLLDTYNSNTTIEFYNNLAFELDGNTLINKQGSTTAIDKGGNVYKKSMAEAVGIDFVSKVKTAGAKLTMFISRTK